MEQNEKNSESMLSRTKYVNMDKAAYRFRQSLTGESGTKDSEKKLLDNIYEFFLNVKRFSLNQKLNAFIILTSKEDSLRRLLQLHKNKRSLIIAFEYSPTNNNTHTHALEVETP